MIDWMVFCATQLCESRSTIDSVQPYGWVKGLAYGEREEEHGAIHLRPRNHVKVDMGSMTLNVRGHLLGSSTPLATSSNGDNHTARPRYTLESNATEGSITLLLRGAPTRGGFGYGVRPCL